MIKRLRWKMVGINMAIVTAVLLTVFASVFFISRAGLARESTLALEEALQTGTYDPLTPGQAAGSRPCFVAVVYDGGTVRVSGSSYYRFKVLDGLITNFHLPESTLIMLVSALAGREHILAAYEEAVREKYRFFSFGDAMLILDRNK